MKLNKKQFIRRGFTLLELLIVVSLIAGLAALSIVAMNGVVEQAEIAATTTTVLKVNSLLEERIEAFNRSFRGAQQDSYIADTVELLKNVDGRFDIYRREPDNAPPALRLLAYKAAFRFEIPQRFVERTDVEGTSGAIPAGMPLSIYRAIAVPTAIAEITAELTAATGTAPTAAAVNALVPARVTAKFSNHTSDSESAELLYFALTASGNFGSFSGGADQFTSDEIADTDGDGLPEFIDAWGQPLRFYRWPTRMFDLDAPNPFEPDFDDPSDPTDTREVLPIERDYAGILFKGLPAPPTIIGTSIQRDLLLVDPDDPVGILYTFIEDPQFKQLGIDLTQEFNEDKYHTPDTYHAPLIVSAGPDGLMGLREPNDVNPVSGIYGNLAQFADTTATSPEPSDATLDALFDNLTNRNRRAGSTR